MFLFIVYGVGPRHCQNVGCSKSTAKAQLWDTPSVKLTKWVNLCTPFPAQLLPPSSPRLWAPVGLASGSAQSHSNTFPAKVSHLTHTSPPEGQRPHSSHTPLSPPGGQRPHTHTSLTSRRAADQCSLGPMGAECSGSPGNKLFI